MAWPHHGGNEGGIVTLAPSSCAAELINAGVQAKTPELASVRMQWWKDGVNGAWDAPRAGLCAQALPLPTDGRNTRSPARLVPQPLSRGRTAPTTLSCGRCNSSTCTPPCHGESSLLHGRRHSCDPSRPQHIASERPFIKLPCPPTGIGSTVLWTRGHRISRTLTSRRAWQSWRRLQRVRAATATTSSRR